MYEGAKQTMIRYCCETALLLSVTAKASSYQQVCRNSLMASDTLKPVIWATLLYTIPGRLVQLAGSRHCNCLEYIFIYGSKCEQGINAE